MSLPDHIINPNPSITTQNHIANAIESSDMQSLRVLIYQHPSMINDSIIQSWTPLMWAISKGSEATIRTLVELGADTNHININGTSPLTLAAAKGKLDFIDLLLTRIMD